MSKFSRAANRESGLLVLVGLGSMVVAVVVLAAYVLSISWLRGLSA